MYESDDKVSKWKIEVRVELDDGARLLGFLFVKPMQRLSDLLNDQRSFLPMQTADGLIVQLAKSTIAKVVQLDQTVEAGRQPFCTVWSARARKIKIRVND